MIKIDLKKIWHDPVWSKVIAAGVIFIFSQLLILIWSLISKLNFVQVYQKIYQLLFDKYSLKGCIITIGIFIFILEIFRLINKIWNPTKKNIVSSKAENVINKNEIIEDLSISEASTVFFHYRFCDAFPGFSLEYQWFNKNKEINTRLKLLLAYPTRFKKRSGHDVTVDPIWWFHGSSASPIDSFKILDRKKVLMNIDELLIEKIAAYRGRLYYEDFVYVQCLADKPTGIYKYDKDKIPELNKNYDEYREEFGVYKHRFISRREYDDGSALIRGKPVRVEDAELRTRNLTRYNFIIAAKFSPYNCDDFYTNSDVYFIQLLKNEIDFDVFINWMRKFPKNRNDY